MPSEFDAQQQVQVWRQSRMVRWHGVTVTTDSMSGIPFQRSLDCDACRVAVGLTTIDSVRIGKPVGGFWKSAGLVYLSLLAVYVAFYIYWGS
jgi:hypothetical protein